MSTFMIGRRGLLAMLVGLASAVRGTSLAQARQPLIVVLIHGKESALEYADDGGLIAYSTEARALFRRAANYVDRILKGAKPADLPVERRTRFELVLNLKTARALGITLPQPMVLRADRLIE